MIMKDVDDDIVINMDDNRETCFLKIEKTNNSASRYFGLRNGWKDPRRAEKNADRCTDGSSLLGRL